MRQIDNLQSSLLSCLGDTQAVDVESITGLNDKVAKLIHMREQVRLRKNT